MALRRKFNGAKTHAEAWDCTERYSGRRATYKRRSINGSECGFYTRENAGMSSENYVRIITAENLRNWEEGSSAPSKPGAKARLKSVADAYAVKNPQPQKD